MVKMTRRNIALLAKNQKGKLKGLMVLKHLKTRANKEINHSVLLCKICS